jgi:hypothetical protein
VLTVGVIVGHHHLELGLSSLLLRLLELDEHDASLGLVVVFLG